MNAIPRSSGELFRISADQIIHTYGFLTTVFSPSKLSVIFAGHFILCSSFHIRGGNAMKTVSAVIVASMMVLFVAFPARADVTNVATGAEVQLMGAPFFTGGWGGGIIVDPSTIVDGVFLPQGHQWDQGAVWWDSTDNQARWIEIKLDETYVIESLIAQVDDNDAYELYYWDLGLLDWKLLWHIPNYDIYNNIDLWGMQTRPNPYDNSERYLLATPVVTNAFLLKGDMTNSDRLFAVSEFQAFGAPYYRGVHVDIKPQSCPNPLNVVSQGVLPVAILGSADFDVTTIDPASVSIFGVNSIRSSYSDVATPYEPNAGQVGAYACTTAGQDGFLDLTLKFNSSVIVAALESSLGRPLVHGEIITIPVTGFLKEEFGSLPITGEDVVVIIRN
jgi:hypothetical protein